MKTCSKCVMPETAESLKFDDEGCCSVCKQLDQQKDKVDWKKRANEFDKIIDKYKGKGKYDCLVFVKLSLDSHGVAYMIPKPSDFNFFILLLKSALKSSQSNRHLFT